MRAFGLVLASVFLTAPATGQERVTIMTYNVENFFDSADDPRYPNDAETLHNDSWVAEKAKSVARVVARFDEGRGPDIVVLTEIESEAALNALRAALPNGGAAYVTSVIFDADPNRPAPKPDRRGIDVALLSKLSKQSGMDPRTHAVDLTMEPQCRDDDGAPGSTRDILEVTLTLPDGQPLTVLGVHLPSGLNPRICRELAARRLEALASALPSERLIIAAGDFNFNCAPAEQVALRRELAQWSVPAVTDNGCRGAGSQYFGQDRTWSFLDVIAQRAPSSAASAWSLDQRTFRAILTDFEQLFWDEQRQVMRPKVFRFNESTGRSSGISDHWPVAVDFVKR